MRKPLGGSYEFMDETDQAALLERIEKVREHKVNGAIMGGLRGKDLDLILEPANEWAKYSSPKQAKDAKKDQGENDRDQHVDV